MQEYLRSRSKWKTKIEVEEDGEEDTRLQAATTYSTVLKPQRHGCLDYQLSWSGGYEEQADMLFVVEGHKLPVHSAVLPESDFVQHFLGSGDQEGPVEVKDLFWDVKLEEVVRFLCLVYPDAEISELQKRDPGVEVVARKLGCSIAIESMNHIFLAYQLNWSEEYEAAADILFVVEGHRLPVHSAVLADSIFLQHCLSQGPQKGPVEVKDIFWDVKLEDVVGFLCLVYPDAENSQLQKGDQGVLAVAKKLAFPNVIQSIEALVASKEMEANKDKTSLDAPITLCLIPFVLGLVAAVAGFGIVKWISMDKKIELGLMEPVAKRIQSDFVSRLGNLIYHRAKVEPGKNANLEENTQTEIKPWIKKPNLQKTATGFAENCTTKPGHFIGSVKKTESSVIAQVEESYQTEVKQFWIKHLDVQKIATGVAIKCKSKLDQWISLLKKTESSVNGRMEQNNQTEGKHHWFKNLTVQKNAVEFAVNCKSKVGQWIGAVKKAGSSVNERMEQNNQTEGKHHWFKIPHVQKNAAEFAVNCKSKLDQRISLLKKTESCVNGRMEQNNQTEGKHHWFKIPHVQKNAAEFAVNCKSKLGQWIGAVKKAGSSVNERMEQNNQTEGKYHWLKNITVQNIATVFAVNCTSKLSQWIGRVMKTDCSVNAQVQQNN